MAPDGDDQPAKHAYQVRLEVFEGPFDLLLQLIARRKLDVSEVDLAEITGDFLAHLRLDDPAGGVAALDLDTATHFLVVAATLIELKAARLLPAEDDGELEELLAEARDMLYARLLEYRAFREVGQLLDGLLERNAGYAARDVPLEPRYQRLVPEAELTIDAEGLAALAAAAFAPKPVPRVSVAHIHRAYLTVRDAASRLLARLDGLGDRETFAALVAGCTPAERVVHFLAVLELFKIGHVDIEQEGRWGPVTIERRQGDSDLSILELAEADQPTPADDADDGPDVGGAPAAAGA